MWGKALYECHNITPLKGEDFITGNQPLSLYFTLLFLQFSSLSISYVCGLPVSKSNFSSSKQVNQSLQKLELAQLLELVSRLFKQGLAEDSFLSANSQQCTDWLVKYTQEWLNFLEYSIKLHVYLKMGLANIIQIKIRLPVA